MDIIFIKGLVVTTIIGIYDYERSFPQRLIFDLDIGYSKQVGIYDDVKNYVDYQKVSYFVNILIEKNCYFLLEAVAESVANGIILSFHVPWVRVKVVKPGAVSEDVCVGVVVEREIHR